MRLNNITYASRNFFFCAHDSVMWLLTGVFLRPIAAHLSKYPLFCGMIILMTFICALKMVSLLSRNFISTSMLLPSPGFSHGSC